MRKRWKMRPWPWVARRLRVRRLVADLLDVYPDGVPSGALLRAAFESGIKPRGFRALLARVRADGLLQAVWVNRHVGFRYKLLGGA